LRSNNPAWETARVNVLRLVLLGLAALAGIVTGAALLQKAIRPVTSSAPLIATASTRPGEPGTSTFEIDAARRAFEEKLKTAPEFAAFFDRLKTVFPSEYESFLGAFVQRSATSGEIASADLLLAEAARSLRLSRGIVAAKAGRQALEHIFELHFAMLRALAAKDPHLCVNFLYGGGSPGFFEFSAQNRDLVAAMAIAGIDAIHDGEIKRIEGRHRPGRISTRSKRHCALKVSTPRKSKRFSTARPAIHPSATQKCAVPVRSISKPSPRCQSPPGCEFTV
jgi:hypothetical protein